MTTIPGRVFAVLAPLILVPTVLSAADGTQPPSPQFGTFGLDLATEDKSVRPGDDFFKYAEGQWLKTANIPADRTSWRPR